MEVVLGTYDEVLLGFRLVEIDDNLQIEASFTDNSHAGSVRCVAVSKNGILASGSADETIRLFNLRKQKELGTLMHHDGSITSLEFYKNFMFSTSEDGKLCVWKTFTWECLRTLKGHKGAVHSVSIHPTGKLALTVGKDRSLRTWNLITGRSAFITNLHQVGDVVKWSPEGDKYIIIVQNKLDIYSVETAEIIVTVQAEGRINCVEFLNNDVCCYGGEGGIVTFFDISQSREVHTCETGTVRIKGLCVTCCKIREHERILTIGSSEGKIKIYSLKQTKEEISTEILVEHDTGFRVTCLAVYNTNKGEVNDKVNDAETVPQHIRKEENVSDNVASEDSDNDVDGENGVVTEAKQTIIKEGLKSVNKPKGNKDRKRRHEKQKNDDSKKICVEVKTDEAARQIDVQKTDNKTTTGEPKTSASPGFKKKNKRKGKSGKQR